MQIAYCGLKLALGHLYMDKVGPCLIIPYVKSRHINVLVHISLLALGSHPSQAMVMVNKHRYRSIEIERLSI